MFTELIGDYVYEIAHVQRVLLARLIKNRKNCRILKTGSKEKCKPTGF